MGPGEKGEVFSLCVCDAIVGGRDWNRGVLQRRGRLVGLRALFL